MNSDKEIIKILSLLSIHNNPVPDKPIKPEDCNKTISNKLTNPLNEISDEITNQMNNIAKGITPTALKEKIFEKLEEEGVLIHLQGNEHYKKSFPVSPGRKPSNETFEDHGGRRSIYFISNGIQQLRDSKKASSYRIFVYKIA